MSRTEARLGLVSPAQPNESGRAGAAPAVRSLRMGVLAVDGCMLSSVSAPLDALRIADTLLHLREPSCSARLEGVIVGIAPERPLRTAHGLEVTGLHPADTEVDVLMVPGVMHSSATDLFGDMQRYAAEAQLLRDFHARGIPIAASCSGTVLAAWAGLLDGRRATTSWWLATAFRRRFPAVKLEPEAMLVEDGEITTAGGASAVFDCVLRWIARHAGDALSQQTARMLLVDADRQSQAPYVSQALIERPRDSLTERAERYLAKSLHAEVSVSGLAQHLGTSERSLLRHFRSQFGVSPLEHIQHMRVERAKALLESTQLSFDEVVERCGYTDVSSFRKLFKRATSLTPADYRERFRLRARG